MTANEPSGMNTDRVVLAHGGGGVMTGRLIAEHFVTKLKNDLLTPLDDGAIVPWRDGEVVFTTDSYVITPLEFPGGDIGSMSVAGTINDLAVMGAKPIALSLGMIIEEGLPMAVLDRIVDSIAETAKAAGVCIATGDTKVIERRSGDGLFINTAGIGRMRPDVRLSTRRIEADDAILVSGTLADHGLTIMSVRNDIEFESELRSDAAPLNGLIEEMLVCGADVKFMRDATRGGVAGVLADLSENTGLSIEIDEAELPITTTARHAAEMLGLDPITVANEGKCVSVVAKGDAEKLLEAMRAHPLGKRAAIIGRMTSADPPLVELNTLAGGQRIIQRPYGEDLPRIC